MERLAHARQAASKWAALSVGERTERITALQGVLLQQTDKIVDGICGATGKVRSEALLGEIYPLVDGLGYYQRHAEQILADRSVSTSPFSFPGASARILRKPFGVVAVFSPGNYPLQLSMLPAISALIAGNAVLLKPSEATPDIVPVIEELFQSIGLPAGLVQCISGGPDVGQALIDAGPDLVFFTGGLVTGRAIMARAAQHPIPVILELGGKDPMLVFADACMERAVNAAVYGAFCNSGQVCVSVERLYVEQACYSEFVKAVTAATSRLRLDAGSDSDLGQVHSAAQRAIINAHYEDALAQGAQASGPLFSSGRDMQPVVLWDVKQTMRVMREETFGPLLPIMPFATEQQAIALANDCEFGLNASVWTHDLNKGERVARQLEVGNWAINDVIKNIGHAGLPFGGTKKSGFGRYHGADGLLSFTFPVSGLTSRSKHALEPNWFPYSGQRYEHLKGFMDFLYSKDPLRERYARNSAALMAFRQYASLDLRQRWENLKLSLPWKRSY